MPPEPSMPPVLIYGVALLAGLGLWFVVLLLGRICASLED